MIMVAMLSVGFASCGSDDDNKGGSNSPLVGTWYNVSGSYTTAWKFNSDGTCYVSNWSGENEEWDYDDQGRWTTSGNTLSTTFDDEVEQYTYTISNDGKTLTLTRTNRGSSRTYTKQ